MSQTQVHLENYIGDDFNSVQVSGLNAKITVGKAYDGLHIADISQPDNKPPFLTSEIKERCLILKPLNGSTLTVQLYVPTLLKLEALDGASVQIENVSGDVLELIAQSETTVITASGTNANLRAQANDGATIVLSDFKARNISSGASRGGRIIS